MIKIDFLDEKYYLYNKTEGTIMTQISLHIEDVVANQLNTAARLRNCSVSNYITSIVTEWFSKSNAEELHKRELLRKLRGVIKDPTVTEPSDVDMTADIQRRYELI